MKSLTEEAIRELRRKGKGVKSKETGKAVKLLVSAKVPAAKPPVPKKAEETGHSDLLVLIKMLFESVNRLEANQSQAAAQPEVSIEEKRSLSWEFTLERGYDGLIKKIKAEPK